MAVPTIKKVRLSELNINDSFFDYFKKTYFEFDKWFAKKQKQNNYGYVTYLDNKLSSLLILKIENNESYSDFDKNFSSEKKLKVSTFKVLDTGNEIGRRFLEIIDEFARANDIKEIYITVFEAQKDFIKFIEKNGYKYYCNKDTLVKNGTLEKERVYTKELLWKKY